MQGLGLTSNIRRATLKDYWKGPGIAGGATVNLYYGRVDKMSSAIGGLLGLTSKIRWSTLKDYWKGPGIAWGRLIPWLQ